jgi:hypothetical protein
MHAARCAVRTVCMIAFTCACAHRFLSSRHPLVPLLQVLADEAEFDAQELAKSTTSTAPASWIAQPEIGGVSIAPIPVAAQ